MRPPHEDDIPFGGRGFGRGGFGPRHGRHDGRRRGDIRTALLVRAHRCAGPRLRADPAHRGQERGRVAPERRLRLPHPAAARGRRARHEHRVRRRAACTRSPTKAGPRPMPASKRPATRVGPTGPRRRTLGPDTRPDRAISCSPSGRSRWPARRPRSIVPSRSSRHASASTSSSARTRQRRRGVPRGTGSPYALTVKP